MVLPGAESWCGDHEDGIRAHHIHQVDKLASEDAWSLLKKQVSDLHAVQIKSTFKIYWLWFVKRFLCFGVKSSQIGHSLIGVVVP